MNESMDQCKSMCVTSIFNKTRTSRKCLNSYFSIFVISDYKTYLKDSIIQLLGLVPHSYAIFSYRNNTPLIVSQDLTRSNSIERKSNIKTQSIGVVGKVS